MSRCQFNRCFEIRINSSRDLIFQDTRYFSRGPSVDLTEIPLIKPRIRPIGVVRPFGVIVTAFGLSWPSVTVRERKPAVERGAGRISSSDSAYRPFTRWYYDFTIKFRMKGCSINGASSNETSPVSPGEITRPDGILPDFNFHFAKVTDVPLFLSRPLVSVFPLPSPSPLRPSPIRPGVPLFPSSSTLCVSSISIGMPLCSLYRGASPPI